MASNQYINLGAPAWITGSVAAIYTNPSSTTTYIRAIRYHNTDTVAHKITVYEVPNNAGAVGTYAANEEMFSYTLQPGELIADEICGPGLTLTGVNDTIQAICDTASKVTVKFIGAINA